jgi:hypothetical protein
MNDPDSSNSSYGYIAKSEGGQAMMDYLVVCAALAFALFYPIKDDPASPDKARTAAQIVLDSFRLAYQNISHAISLPG